MFDQEPTFHLDVCHETRLSLRKIQNAPVEHRSPMEEAPSVS